jgi:hypothetical protein
MLKTAISKRLIAMPIFALVLMIAGSAAATSTRYFAELLTSQQTRILPSNVRATIDTSADSGFRDILLGGNIEAGAGLGDGYVSGTGDYIMYQHRFTPSADVASIVKATLAVGVLDDQFCDSGEKVEIRLDGDIWKTGIATINLLAGNVTAYLGTDDDGSLTVAVISRAGDFVVMKSLLVVEYLSPDVVAVPEPGAALLFAAGMFVVARSTRRNRRLETIAG